jgi:hypothetical protein
MKNTILLFTSDNGGLPEGSSLPYRGGKHSIWEGGVHVPAAIWWPGTFDANTAPYSPGNNRYNGNVGYYDIYPTLMAMTGNTFHATGADGFNFWDELQSNTPVRQGNEDPFFEMWNDHGFVRTDEWKLIYSESANRTELYQYKSDIDESDNVSDAYPEITAQLITLYKGWLNNNKLAVPFVKLDTSNLHSVDPDPDGEILEVKARQTNSNNSGVYLRFANGYFTNGKIGHYIEPGDRVEYDIYVAEDSEQSKGIYYSPGSGWTPVFNANNGINQNGIRVHSQQLPKGKWIRHVVGTGTVCPGASNVNYIVLRGGPTGYYHFYLDNIVIRKSDGTIRSVIWQNSTDSGSLLYRYKNINYSSFSSAQNAANFPFGDIQISTLKTNNEALVYPIRKFIYTDVVENSAHTQEFEIVNYTPQDVGVNSVSLRGANAAFFEITLDELTGTSIGPMSKKAINVRYDPASSGGNHQADIVIDSNLGKDTLYFKSGEVTEPVYRKSIDHCDVSTGWSSNNGLSVNNEDHLEWGACLEMTGSETNEFKKSFSPPIETRATIENGYLQFWYYVSDVTKFDSKNQVEIGSGGKNDVDEFNWNIHSKLTNGWNLLKLKFSEAGISPSGANPDLRAINWMRIYHWKTGELSTRIDGIQVIDPTVNTSTDTKEMREQMDGFYLLPNPSTGIVQIVLSNESEFFNIRIFDLQGRTVLVSTCDQKTTELDLSHIKKGIYIVSLSNACRTVSQKLIIA